MISAWSCGCTPSIFFILIKSGVEAIFLRHSVLLQKTNETFDSIRNLDLIENYFKYFFHFSTKTRTCLLSTKSVNNFSSIAFKTLSSRSGSTNCKKKKFTLISRHRKGALRVLTFAGQSAQPFDVHFIGIADEINAINIGRRLRHGNARRN